MVVCYLDITILYCFCIDTVLIFYESIISTRPTILKRFNAQDERFGLQQS